MSNEVPVDFIPEPEVNPDEEFVESSSSSSDNQPSSSSASLNLSAFASSTSGEVEFSKNEDSSSASEELPKDYQDDSLGLSEAGGSYKSISSYDKEVSVSTASTSLGDNEEISVESLPKDEDTGLQAACAFSDVGAELDLGATAEIIGSKTNIEMLDTGLLRDSTDVKADSTSSISDESVPASEAATTSTKSLTTLKSSGSKDQQADSTVGDRTSRRTRSRKNYAEFDDDYKSSPYKTRGQVKLEKEKLSKQRPDRSRSKDGSKQKKD